MCWWIVVLVDGRMFSIFRGGIAGGLSGGSY